MYSVTQPKPNTTKLLVSKWLNLTEAQLFRGAADPYYFQLTADCGIIVTVWHSTYKRRQIHFLGSLN